ncbi:DUF58 domain-containing protein [Ulvibacter litoralis]|uniref:Uncharacterized conserved protein, DUF58 family, contains vWF domain n=1 Tax=Ulvibacter litoralis TaxID=227084 RepID=A0A1G7EYH0_9FLAO|nr:DUF58 domain-containing protein [Ulvibacter litoralis]GHC53400.1 hypothetical protein GCM10008083_16760 [Ulvibacter litoralis]SDE68743.1 Uncharacterized conserved protein, DUF58 family, contains vWF domain [Ulvibacter litoralis]
MKQFFKSLYFTKRFFIAIFLLAILFVVSYFFGNLFWVIKLLFFILILLVVADCLLLYLNKTGIQASRLLPEKLSNGDENPIEIKLVNRFQFTVALKIIDELPIQWQIRDFKIETVVKPSEEKKFTYTVRPTERGEYHFGNLNVFSSSILGLVSRRQQFSAEAMVPNYPSFLQLKKYDFIAFSNRLKFFGLKKIRRIGNTMEFEQIKEYVAGDDIRNINWKATAKKSELMVNQFQDEKSQPIYSVIDKGRVMKMPFNNLSLLDYAINATLVISNIALKKQDKAGMFTFSRKIEDRVVAQRRSSQMNLILESLYNVKTDFSESDFSRLYVDIKRHVKQRSLLLLYTNFETMDALHRQLPYFQAINKTHLLVVIFFENTELKEFTDRKASNTREIFEKTIAEKFRYEKKLIVNELHKYGIQTILTAPEALTVNTINKYLEIKARGLL